MTEPIAEAVTGIRGGTARSRACRGSNRIKGISGAAKLIYPWGRT